MKILFLNHNVEGKGTYWRCYWLARSLVKQGNTVIVLCLQKKRSIKISKRVIEGVQFYFLPRFANKGVVELPGHLLRIFLILIYSLFGRFEIIHSFNVASPTCGFPVFFIWFFKKVKFIKTKLIVDWDDLWGKEGLTHLNNQGIFAENLSEFLETRIPPLADAVTVVSEELKNRAIKTGVKKTKIFKIINGSNAELIGKYSQGQSRKDLGIDEKEKIVCFPGVLTINLPFVLSSFKESLQKNPKLKLYLLNLLSKDDEKLILNSGIEKNILVVGFKPYDIYLKYVAAANVVLLPRSSHILDRCEFPARLGDFMSLGKPIVTNKSGDAWKILEDNKAGLVANMADENDFALKINSMLEDTGLAKRFSLKVMELAKTKYSWDFLATRLLKEVY